MHNAPASLRYLGHATVLIELAGRRILTDPVLTDRVAFIRRTAASPELDHRQAIDLVLISHGHLDHLHRASMEAVGRDVPPSSRAGWAPWFVAGASATCSSPIRTSASSLGR